MASSEDTRSMLDVGIVIPFVDQVGEIVIVLIDKIEIGQIRVILGTDNVDDQLALHVAPAHPCQAKKGGRINY